MRTGDPQTFNRYSYVRNDPVNRIDPSGLEEGLVCYVDGILQPSCSGAFSLLGSGAGIIGPLNMTRFNAAGGVEYFHAFADGFSGWLPQGAVYNGNGYWGFPGARSNGPPVLHDGLGTGTSYGQPLEGDRLDRNSISPFLTQEGPQDPGRGGGQDDKEIQRRIEAGKAWDRWNAWNACAHPIWEKYQNKLNEYNKIGGEAFWNEVGVGIAAGFSVGTLNGPGMWGTFLLGLKVHRTEKDKMNQIHADYRAEVTSTCGPEVPKPAKPN